MSPDSKPDATGSATQQPPGAPRPPGQDELLGQELLQIYGHRTDEFTRDALWGLALSGGGIRSATFALGALQGLAHTGWLGSFHFVSTVSGGGYAGSYLQGLLHRNDLETVREKLAPSNCDPAPAAKAPGTTPARAAATAGEPDGPTSPVVTGATSPAILALRKFSNYLSPRNSILGGHAGMVTSYLANVVMVQLLLVPFLLLLMLGASLAYAGLFQAWPVRWGLVALMAVFAVLPTLGYLGISEKGRIIRAARTEGALCATIVLTLAAMLVWPKETASLESTIATYVVLLGAFALSYLTWTHATHDALKRKLDLGEALALIAGMCVLAGAVYLMQRYFSGISTTKSPFLFMVIAKGMPMLAVACFLAGTITLGLSPLTSQMDRNRYEQWAEVSGKCGLYILLVVVALLLITAPRAIELWVSTWFEAEHPAQQAKQVPQALEWKYLFPIASALAAIVSGVGAWVLRRDLGDSTLRKRKSFQKWRSALVFLAPMLLVAAVLLGSAWILSGIFDVVGPVTDPKECGNPDHVWRCQSLLVQDIPLRGWAVLGLVVVAVFAIWYALAWKLRDNPNEFSMNGFYRNRLVRAYLAATVPNRNGALFEPSDDLKLSELLHRPGRAGADAPDDERPLYPLLCCAVNLTARTHLDWQDRKAASFLLSPLYCGHLTPRDRKVDAGDNRDAGGDAYDIGDELTRLQAPPPPAQLSRAQLSPSPQAHEITLGTAMAISGAAVSPNMGYHSSTMVTFLMTLFNARLGASVRNSHRGGKAKRGPALSLLDELLGNTRGTANSAYVSDGGHFENIGIYELVRRRCRFVLCVDASADPEREFGDLGNAIHLCRVDLATEIDIDVSRMRPDPKTGRSKQCATVGKIDYGNGKHGVLLYIKPCLLGDEPADITHYAGEHPEFPHEPTVDQFFDERQFEAYRHLGFVSCLRVLVEATERAEADVAASQKSRERGKSGSKPGVDGRTPTSAGVRSERPGFKLAGLDDHEKKGALLLHLRHRFFEPSDANALHFTRHGEAVNRLFQELRKNPDLASLDSYLYPGWQKGGGTPAAIPSSDSPEFRACFYFMQELIQLMESVYLDLHLEANHAHPDNRGWINIFRQWAWVPMFRLAWALSAQTYGSRFVAFCESRLFVPDLIKSLRVKFVHDVGLPHTQIGQDVVDSRARGYLNAVEDKLLRSPLLYEDNGKARDEHWWLGLLLLDWPSVFTTKPVPGMAPAMGVGFVVLSGDDPARPTTIRLLRVPDHIRRMGLGTRFVREVAMEFPSVDCVDIAPGEYGGMGLLSEAEAERQVKRLSQMLNEARQSLRKEPAGAARAR